MDAPVLAATPVNVAPIDPAAAAPASIVVSTPVAPDAPVVTPVLNAQPTPVVATSPAPVAATPVATPVAAPVAATPTILTEADIFAKE